jgi:hypothetical protein
MTFRQWKVRGVDVPIPELVLLLDDVETARALGLTLDSLETLVSAGYLEPIVIRAKRRFLLEEVQALMRTRPN